MGLNQNKKITIILIITIFFSATLTTAQTEEKTKEKINYKSIIDQGINLQLQPTDLQTWFESQPKIKFASLIQNSLTIKFIDDSYTVLLDITSQIGNQNKKITTEKQINQQQKLTGKTAVILNPSEDRYGYRYCKKIIQSLERMQYDILYKANDEVNLNFIENNLSAEVVYMNTHAGYWDTDGDGTSDTVIIATAEPWTNETETTYEFEYNNQMILKGILGDTELITFTPHLIDHYYQNNTFSNTMIYMATCEASYDDSMAKVFLNNGAETYIGWDGMTVSWLNRISSIRAFKLFNLGFTSEQVCKIIRYGGFYNRLFRSKLTFFGNGDLKLK